MKRAIWMVLLALVLAMAVAPTASAASTGPIRPPVMSW